MKNISLIATAFAVCFLFAPLVSAQSVISGYASCSYDYDTHLVTGVVTTELSYSAQDWYQGMVAGSLYTGGRPVRNRSRRQIRCNHRLHFA